MPAIEYSQGLHNNVLSSVLNLFAGSGGNTQYYSAQWATAYAGVQLMKGTQQTTWNGLINDRYNDSLCMWSFRGGEIGNLQLSSRTNNVFTMRSYYVQARQSGTATWFRWAVSQNFFIDSYVNSGYLSQAYITGTVGGVGSGADLIMQGFNSTDPVTIVSGQRYKIENLVFTFPRTWTY